MIKPFKEKINFTRPLIPDMDLVNKNLKQVFESGWLTNMGQMHEKLTETVKKRLKIENVSIFNNGMTALMVALKALDLKGEAITTPFTFPATPNALLWNQLTPVFCDIKKESLNIDPEEIEKKITKKTSAILAVHVFGNPCEVEKIDRIAKKYKLKVIYDAAHAYGLEYKGRPISEFGDLSMFSFHSTKLFHTVEGGCLAFKDKKLERKLYLLKNFGIAWYDKVELPGLNGKLNEVSSSIGILIDRMIDEEKKQRSRIYNIYKENLKDLPGIYHYEKEGGGIKDSYQYFVIRIDREEFGKSRDYVCDRLADYNVFARKYFYPLCSNYPYFKNNKSAKKENLKNANIIVNQTLALPFFGKLQSDDVRKICDIIKKTYHE